MSTQHNRVVVLMTEDGKILAHLQTDRDEFAPVATFGRDRIFALERTGELGSDADGVSISGAVYVEVTPWRISLKTLDNPGRINLRRRKRPSAKILPFVRRTGGAA
ncbi:hypothetical protein [uncultured Sphingomonas sp.]|uniref:hypothetical protein n=1 Tax=uncultured Sphingomonas sp. TaxID=158754 RepID=UPI00258EE357|nr:hypothetical protein [uncultured Sphingomonas sp.]